MPMRIADTRIRNFVDTQKTAPTPKISDANVIELLAAIKNARQGEWHLPECRLDLRCAPRSRHGRIKSLWILAARVTREIDLRQP